MTSRDTKKADVLDVSAGDASFASAHAENVTGGHHPVSDLPDDSRPSAYDRLAAIRAMALEAIGDIGDAALTENTSETVTWETSTDWDSATSESYVSHSSNVINMEPGVDSFEDLSNGAAVPAAWNPVSASITSGTAADGSLSIDNNDPASKSHDPIYYSTQPSGHAPTKITWAYRETSSDRGVGFWLRNGSGNIILEAGSANPEVGYKGGAGHNCLVSSPSPNYKTWRRFTFTMDYANNQFDVLWEDIGGSTANKSVTGVGFINGASGVNKVSVGGLGNVWCGAGSAVPEGYNHDDQIYGVYRKSDLKTATKSFSGPVKPDLQNLKYTLDTQTIVLDVIGSPGTSSEEIVSQTLGGASSYSLSWTNSHSDFRTKINLETGDRGGTSVPSLSRVELIGSP